MARRSFTNISLATRLSLVALLVTLVSLAVTAVVGLRRGSELADDLTEDRLVTVAASRSDEVALYVDSVRRELIALAASPATGETIRSLGDAYLELDGDPIDNGKVDAVTEHYLVDVAPALEAAGSSQIGVSFLVPDGPAAIYLQDAYTVPDADDGDGPAVVPSLVLDPGDGSDYSRLHVGVHQTYGQIGIRSGFDDLYLIDARRDVVVYSARKRIDFATSLDLGPFSGSSLARLIDTVATDAPGTARLADFAAYPPAVERPTAFVASPVVDGGVLVGYVAAALPIGQIDAIMSGGGAWEGLGDSGESYLVGPDGTMRTTARAYQSAPTAYFSDISPDGVATLTDLQQRRITATGTTALVQPVDRTVVTAAEQGPGITDSISYTGDEVLTAYREVPLDDVEWVVFADVPTDELDEPIKDYARDMLFAIALFVVVVTFVAVRWADRLMAPIRAIADRLRRVRASTDLGGTAPTTPAEVAAATARGDRTPLPTDGPDEYQELSHNVDQMLDRLQQRERAVAARSAERAALLRQFLPAAVARRTEESDGDVLDHVRNASVVVLVVDGLGDLVGERHEQEVRDLLGEIVDEIDALAADLGLERVKLTGGTYYAVCGVSRPYLDHAPRSVAFALAARDLVVEVSGDRLALHAGVDTGPVSVGLTNRAALVYDAWGTTVAGAEALARRAGRGTVAVSGPVQRQLPGDFVTETRDADDDTFTVSRQPATEASPS